MTLRLDTGALQELGGDLTAISREFRYATQRSDRAADAVGHEGLAEAIRSFASTWDDVREQMGGDVEMLAQFTAGIASAFDSVDEQLAAALVAGAPQSQDRGLAHIAFSSPHVDLKEHLLRLCDNIRLQGQWVLGIR